MAVVIRSEERREMPVPFTGRAIIQIQQTSAESVLEGRRKVLPRAFQALIGFLLT